MALNRIERITALSLFLKQEYGTLGRLIEETANLNKDQKIDVLSSLVQLSATEAARVSYSDDTKQLIDDVVSVISDEDRDSKLVIVGQEETG